MMLLLGLYVFYVMFCTEQGRKPLFFSKTLRCMIGAVTIGQSTSAISQLGIKDLKVGQSAFVTIRQVCLQHIGEFYHTIKQQQQQQ